MRILLFCENKYAVDILHPIQVEAQRQGEHEVLWYVHKKKIPSFPLSQEVLWTNDIREAYRYHPDAVFVPGNIVPYYLSGVKIQVFHGYAAEKKDHWIIRRYFDTYFTQGPYFTHHFEALARKYGDFEVCETGWTRQDYIYHHLNAFDNEKYALLQEHKKERIVLYAPTFSPKLTSIPYMKEVLREFSRSSDALLLIKFHPLTCAEWVEAYRQLAKEEEHIIWIEDFAVSKYILMADAMISDTSSTVYECLLQNKPVITLRTIAKDIYWRNIEHPSELQDAYASLFTDEDLSKKRKWVIQNYDPYLDGKVAKRMIAAAAKYIHKHGVPEKRKLNLWRKYTSIKTFGWPK